ncbi:NAD(P)/FAD-dependent oxidoreductase [Arsenicicoccus piscis]|uniref:NAD(P)/FAD-dependent oxidoreductase n=1 Tax=Arsenicicoccus piscis TaxID=673954 RepID=UPI0032AE97A2
MTLIDAGDLLHDRPPLSKELLRGEVDESGIRLHDEAWFAASDIALHQGISVDRAVGSAPDDLAVVLADGQTLPAAAVVLATGGLARRLPVVGGDLAELHHLRTVDDARRLRQALVPGRRVCVVGGGLIGAEIASTASDLGAQVILVEPTLPLEAVVGRDVARWLHDLHVAHGVRVVEAAVVEIRTAATTSTRDRSTRGGSTPGGSTSPRLEVVTSDGQVLAVDDVVVGVGGIPDTRVAEASGLEVVPGSGVVVDGAGRTTGAGVYAIGDVALHEHPRLGRTRSEHWDAATRSAARAAAAIATGDGPESEREQEHEHEHEHETPWFWTDRYGHHVEVTGDAVHGDRVVRGVVGEPPFAVLRLVDGALTGAVTVDLGPTGRAVRRLVEAGASVGADLLGDPATDLRALARRLPR